MINIWGLTETPSCYLNNMNGDDEDMETNVNEGLKDLAKGYIRFSIKAEDTAENVKVHADFKEYCKVECDNNYTQGLKTLLEYVKADVKTMAMYELIDALSARIAVLEAKALEPVKEEKKEKELF